MTMKMKYLTILLLLLISLQGMCQNRIYSRTPPKKNDWGVVYTRDGKKYTNQKKYFKASLQNWEYWSKKLNDSSFYHKFSIRKMDAEQYGNKLLDMYFHVDYIETANAYFLQNDHLKKKKLYVLRGYVDTYSGYDFRILTTRLNNNGDRIKVGEKYTFHLYQIYGKDVLIYPKNSDYTVGGVVSRALYYYKNLYIPYLVEGECKVFFDCVDWECKGSSNESDIEN